MAPSWASSLSQPLPPSPTKIVLAWSILQLALRGHFLGPCLTPGPGLVNTICLPGQSCSRPGPRGREVA